MYRPWICCSVHGLFFLPIKPDPNIAVPVLHRTKTLLEHIYLGTPNFSLLQTQTPDNG